MVKEIRAYQPPLDGLRAGYGWLIIEHRLDVPQPARLAAVAGRHKPRHEGSWWIFPERYAPEETLAGHLTFALKWEGVNLAVLHALFQVVPPDRIRDAVLSAPSGSYMRRAWFLYEWLTGTTLDLPDLGKVSAVPVLDPEQQLGIENGELSARHRVRNNLPGTPAFCPLAYRTPAIARLQQSRLGEEARRVIGRTRADVMARAAAFLLLNDSRASYQIENEQPSPDRLHRWGQAIMRAGATRLSIEELESLQREVIGDSRFVRLGLRTEGGFVGEHDRFTRAPIPNHVSARAEDLDSLVNGMIDFDIRAGRGAMDAVAAAAATAFGFVYIHPFEDGNGRIHRWLIHHVLAAAGFAAPGFVFPVSAVMLREISEYRRVLESYSTRLLSHVQWEVTSENNVRVTNDTAPWYRYFDATTHTEFLYHCVETTLRKDLPHEVAFLTAYDEFSERVGQIADMPSRIVNLLHTFLYQNEGRLSQRARGKEFKALSDEEVTRIEALYEEAHRRIPARVL